MKKLLTLLLVFALSGCGSSAHSSNEVKYYVHFNDAYCMRIINYKVSEEGVFILYLEDGTKMITTHIAITAGERCPLHTIIGG